MKLKIGTAMLAAIAMMAVGTQAAVVAFTDFNNSTIGGASNIKTNLNWMLNGIEDPGYMAARKANGGSQALFDSTDFVRDLFAPSLNTGNGNTYWTADISLTVAAGFNVTLTDVTINSVSLNAFPSENVNRRNDYSVFIIDPSATQVVEVTVADTFAGTTAGQPLVTLDFADVALADPGTYTLRIKGGDFTGANETGNHTGLDNLSINGNVSTIPEPSTIAFIGIFGGAIFGVRRFFLI